MKNMKSYIKNLMSTMSSVECLYLSLSMTECLSTRKSTKKFKITLYTYHISQSLYNESLYDSL